MVKFGDSVYEKMLLKNMDLILQILIHYQIERIKFRTFALVTMLFKSQYIWRNYFHILILPKKDRFSATDDVGKGQFPTVIFED